MDTNINIPATNTTINTKTFTTATTNSKHKIEVTVKIGDVDYEEKFDEKQHGLADIVRDGDGFTREELYDLIVTANKSIAQ